MERAEDRVGLVLLGADLAELIDRVEARDGRPPRFPPARTSARQSSPALASERADLAREVDRLRVRLLREIDELPLRLAVANDEARAALAERGVELREALEQKLRARAGLVATVEQPVVEAEDWDDALVAIERRAQRGMVADPQIATKPDDAGPASGHGVNLPAMWRRSRAERNPSRHGRSPMNSRVKA